MAPVADVFLEAVPDEPFAHSSLRGPASRMGQAVDKVEDSTAPVEWDDWSRSALGDVTQYRELPVGERDVLELKVGDRGAVSLDLVGDALSVSQGGVVELG